MPPTDTLPSREEDPQRSTSWWRFLWRCCAGATGRLKGARARSLHVRARGVDASTS